MKIQQGDYFCVYTDSWIANAINAVEKLKALDHEAKYNHAGIIVASDGTTFESRSKIAHYCLSDYQGAEIIIGRHKEMTVKRFFAGYDEIKRWNGYVYPYWRIALFLVGLSKFLHASQIPVCSELVVEHCHHAGLCKHDGYGWNPDNLADKMEMSKDYDIIYKGKLEWKI